ncbi:MAG: efflux RND transporter periplasmic adaptor subunit [Selenomonadaceae bacterium]|nr:efflux RND transporter periplasmic adaptor subunit [Selenomonadaceae bacterium]
MKRYFYFVLTLMFALIIGLISYGAYLNHRDEAQISERMAERTIPLQGAKAKIRNIYSKVFLDTMNLYSEEKTDAVALIDGRITSVDVQKNDNVKIGQTLFVITNESYPIKIRQADIDILKAESEILKAENEVMKAETLLSTANNDLNRYTRLRDRDAVSVEKYEQIETAYREAQVNLKNLRVQKEQMIAQKESLMAQKEQLLIESSYSQVVAPIDGEILIIYRQIGSYVTAGTSLALIGNFHNLYFEMSAEDKLVRMLSSSKEVNLNFKQRELQKIYGTEYEPGNKGHQQVFNAEIVDILPSLDQPAAIRKILWRVDNSSGLLEPQTYSDVTCESIMPHKCLTVPLNAMKDQSHSSVFVFMSDGTIKEKYITAGADDGKYIEILDGLQEGDIVVTSSVGGLTDGMKVTLTLEEGED